MRKVGLCPAATEPNRLRRMSEFVMVNGEGFTLLMEELRAIRQHLDQHISDEHKVLDDIRKDVAKVREEITANKIKLGAIAGGIALLVTTFFSWMWGNLTR